jgi:DNA-binding transcriptional ArsR family regulator
MQTSDNRTASPTQDRKSKGAFERAVSDWLDAVKRHPKLRLAFVVAYEIAQNFNRKDVFERTAQLIAWPSLRTIGEEIGLSKDAVDRHIKKLKEFGLLAIEPGRGRGVSSQYRALTCVSPAVDTSEPADDGADEGTCVSVSETCVSVFETCVSPGVDRLSDRPSDEGPSDKASKGRLPPTPHDADQDAGQHHPQPEHHGVVHLRPKSITAGKPEFERPLVVQSDSAADNVVPIRTQQTPVPINGAGRSRRRPSAGPGHDFDRFWEVYPRKDDAGLAAMKFHAARKLVDVEIIIAGAQRYAAERSGEDPQYKQKAHNWLLAKAWANQPAVPRRGHSSRSYNVIDDFGSNEAWLRAALNVEESK